MSDINRAFLGSYFLFFLIPQYFYQSGCSFQSYMLSAQRIERLGWSSSTQTFLGLESRNVIFFLYSIVRYVMIIYITDVCFWCIVCLA